MLLFLIAAHTAHSATLDVIGARLIGASGVNVGGYLYDVSFIDGFCTNTTNSFR